MKRKILRKKDGRFCQLEIELSEGRLSISGVEGTVTSRASAKAQAFRYWKNYFDDAPAEIMDINKRFSKKFTSSSGAARFVLETDGPFHGLDVLTEDGNEILIGERFGQIRDSLLTWFPEVKPLLKWHLNDMHAECEHQEARGETWAANPGAVCPDCGYKLGSAWKKRELPPEIIGMVHNMPFYDPFYDAGPT